MVDFCTMVILSLEEKQALPYTKHIYIFTNPIFFLASKFGKEKRTSEINAVKRLKINTFIMQMFAYQNKLDLNYYRYRMNIKHHHTYDV